MNSIKKSIITGIVISSIGTAVFASDMTHSELYIQPEFGSIKIEDSSNTAYGASIGYDLEHSSGVYFGADLGYLAISTDNGSASDTAMPIGLKLGYDIYKGVTPYAYAGMTIVGSDLSGYIYGGGAKYQIIDHVAIDASFTTGNIDAGFGPSLSYTQALVGFKFNFSMY